MKVMLCYIIGTFLGVASASKGYDLGAESLRLYSDEFPGVLQGFRKTIEYVNILSDRVAFIKQEIEAMSNGLYYHEMNNLNDALKFAVSGCEPNDTNCEPHSRRTPTAVDSLSALRQSSEELDPVKEIDNENKMSRVKKRSKKQAQDNGVKAINFVNTAMRKKALEKYRAVFNPKEKTQPFSLSKAIDDYNRMLRNKTDTSTTKNGLKYLNEYPLRKYNKNKYVDIAFKHAKQLIEDIITTFKKSLKMPSTGRSFLVDMNE